LDDELPTDPWGGRERSAHVAYDEEETDIGFRARVYEEEDEITQLPERRRGAWEDDETVVERAETGVLGFLIVKEGVRRGQVHRVHGGTTIGRDRAKIILRDPKVSRPHAKFTIEDDQFIIWDFGSENGTFVNDEQIRGAKALNENDTIKIGDTVFVLKTLQ
jgi:pSer/pThr/pTyr-binding forkhead associated (FHA) protein